MMTNLAGWSSSQIFPCYNDQSWTGVICSLHEDNITDPCNCTVTIVVLRLTAASIVGTFPSAIGNLTHLVELTLTDNPELSGNIPKELHNLTNLVIFDLSENALVGSPPSLTAISTLQFVNLSSNYFNGSIILTSIFNTSANLIVLDLSHNNFTGLLPDLSTFSNSLTQLNLSFNSFNPEPYPAWVKGFNQLSMLSLKRNGLSGPFPYDLASLPNLEIL
ncbi:hypothetical protein BDL97_16G066900 [Sphagnum fallax]|nr:hypothetical protein BDL97_16G066900 [Sphagnum fallax]